jgi:cell division protein FtsL
LWGLLLGIVAAVAPFTIYLLQQMDYVRVRYKIEELRSQHERLVEMEQRLRIERASLETPTRVEVRAVRNLGLVQPSPHHVVVVRRTTPGRGNLMARAPDRP